MKQKSLHDLEKFLLVIALAAMGFFVWLAIMFAIGCGGSILPPGPPEPIDAGTAEDCEMACANLAFMQCPGWRGSPGRDETWNTPDDVSCEQACRDIINASSTATLFQRCTARAISCEAVEACFDPPTNGAN